VIKCYCDRCEKEITEKVNKLSLPCHVVEGSGYIDRERNLVSGRMIDYDLCQSCFNTLMTATYNLFLVKPK